VKELVEDALWVAVPTIGGPLLGAGIALLANKYLPREPHWLDQPRARQH